MTGAHGTSVASQQYLEAVRESAKAQKAILLYCDGGSRGNGKAGAKAGWGGVVAFPNGRVVGVYGGVLGATNNQMELQAAIEVLSLLGREVAPEDFNAVNVHTDSEYVKKGISEWLAGWKRRGWRTAAGEAVKNQDAWMALDAQCSQARSVGWNLHWSWVRGHAGNPGNELADGLANLGCDRPGVERVVLTLADAA